MNMHLPSCRNDSHRLLTLVGLFQCLRPEFISKRTVFMCIKYFIFGQVIGQKDGRLDAFDMGDLH